MNLNQLNMEIYFPLDKSHNTTLSRVEGEGGKTIFWQT